MRRSDLSPAAARTPERSAPAGPSPSRMVWLLSAGHAVDDLYQGAVPALIPFFVASRHWNYAAASGITVAATLLSSVAQPVFGALTDRRRLPLLVPLGMSLAGAGWRSPCPASASPRTTRSRPGWPAPFYGVGALGTILGGRLAERFGRIRTVRASYLLTVPALAALWAVPGPAIFLPVVAAAVVLYVSFSLHVTLGHLPGRIGTASGVTLGLAVSVGGLATPALGLIADHAGLRTAMAALILILMPVAATLVGLRMHEPRHTAHAPTPPPASGTAPSPAATALSD